MKSGSFFISHTLIDKIVASSITLQGAVSRECCKIKCVDFRLQLLNAIENLEPLFVHVTTLTLRMKELHAQVYCW